MANVWLLNETIIELLTDNYLSENFDSTSFYHYTTHLKTLQFQIRASKSVSKPTEAPQRE